MSHDFVSPHFFFIPKYAREAAGGRFSVYAGKVEFGKKILRKLHQVDIKTFQS